VGHLCCMDTFHSFIFIFFHVTFKYWTPSVLAFNYFTYLLESQISKQFFHNFHLSESSSTCRWLQASGLAWRLHLYSPTISILRWIISHYTFSVLHLYIYHVLTFLYLMEKIVVNYDFKLFSLTSFFTSLIFRWARLGSNCPFRWHQYYTW